MEEINWHAAQTFLRRNQVGHRWRGQPQHPIATALKLIIHRQDLRYPAAGFGLVDDSGQMRRFRACEREQGKDANLATDAHQLCDRLAMRSGIDVLRIGEQ
ncbi:hypothetical protein Thiosp_03354 [Thiorhodovibrio litoralis]|nr:hypothetical protein Thiosp_03354 [Thiorhodovibrio litoralis]